MFLVDHKRTFNKQKISCCLSSPNKNIHGNLLPDAGLPWPSWPFHGVFHLRSIGWGKGSQFTGDVHDTLSPLLELQRTAVWALRQALRTLNVFCVSSNVLLVGMRHRWVSYIFSCRAWMPIVLTLREMCINGRTWNKKVSLPSQQDIRRKIGMVE